MVGVGTTLMIFGINGQRMWQKAGPRALPALGLLVLCLLVGLLGYSFVQSSTNRLLEAEARIDAERWSKYLSANVTELSGIASGGEVKAETRSLLSRSLAGGHLVSFRVYDARGHLRLQSNDPLNAHLAGKPISMIDSGFTNAIKNNRSATLTRKGKDASEPAYIASALVPITVEQHTVGWLVVNLDQTARQELFYSATAQASLAVCLLLVTAPIFGFWYRARQKAMMEQTIVHLSQRDHLTGFPVKSTFLEKVDVALASHQAGGAQSALIFCSLTGAQAIAQTHGQDAEERFIHQAAARLSSMASGRAEIASAGRGSFLVFVKEVTDPMLVLSLAKEITVNLSAGIEYDGMKLSCQCHSGVALSSTDGNTAALLMRSAEMALLSAREQGTPGYGFFNPETAKDTRRRTEIQRAVSDATESQNFRLDFQPVYNIRTGELNGFEALIRLYDKDLGNISPAEFIPVAEQAGLIGKIGAWCLEEACRVAAQWPPHLMVAVNLSPSQFMSGTLINDVRKALENNQFPGYRLEVEITEGTLMNDSELVLGQLRVLRDMGVAVALDDFGTGYSSLSYLWKFPFSKLKIDRSFVQALDETPSAKGILRSIVKLGHGLGLTVTAEGIENSKQLGILRDLGCDLAQGYLLDRPARVADLAAIILRNFANGLSRRIRETASGRTAA
jgi:predicted signal transduction protein with EAL and GGDEF domain